MATVDEQITFLQNSATSLLSSVTSTANTRWFIGSSALGSAGTSKLFVVDSVTSPSLSPPTQLDVGPLTEYRGIGDWVTQTAQEINDLFFPDTTAILGNLPESWIAGVLNGTTDTGLPSAAEDRLWVTARERATRELLRAEEDAQNAASARGFRVPSGALIQQMRRAREDANKRLNEANNTISVQSAQIKVDLTKLAAQLAADLKPRLQALLVETIKAYAALPGIEADTLRARAAAYQAYYGALREYYGIDLDYQKVKVDIGRSNSQATVQAADINNRHAQVDYDGLVRQNVSAAGAFGQAGAAALSSLNALVASIASAS